MYLNQKTILTKITKLNKTSLTFLGRVGFVLLILTGSIANACDMSAFVQSDFSARCQLLIDLCEKAYLANNLDRPDRQKYAGELSKEWISFYLAHGNHTTIPPSLSFIASDSWQQSINFIGTKISRLVNNKDLDDFEILTFKISLLKNPEELKALQTELKKRRQESKNLDKITNMRSFLDETLIKPAQMIAGRINDKKQLFHRLNASMESFLKAFARIEKRQKNCAKDLPIQGLFNHLNEEIKAEFEFWNSLFYYKTL